ncbi:MAG: PilZ domain-containing protein [Deltaproteobacteria bacterium]|jgi:c-di-GMP-binding flagellar brake protein YcgR|nr:PilZ domain-containing protein [Deltaproteobacteria bacterium]
MVKKRTDDRVVFISMGMVNGNTEQVSCTLENISPAGALVRMSGPVPETIQKGDIIHLKTILLSPVELKCKVVRIDTDQIAVQFIDI